MTIFFAQLKDGVKLTAGNFMGGEFPIMMFGLPAAALAMYHAARPERKKLVAGLLGSGALTSFLTGITETGTKQKRYPITLCLSLLEIVHPTVLYKAQYKGTD